MKNLKFLLAALFAVLMVSGNVSAQAKDKKVATVVFDVDIDCGSCKAKIEKNLPFEKGVKEFEVSLENKTVKVDYRTDKTNEETLRKAIEKLGYKTTVKKEKES
ncbi:MAG: heavy-metal-associated domain-containing protein [Breznakibacter sp.]